MLVFNGEMYEPQFVYKLGSKCLEFAYCGQNQTPVAKIFHKTASRFKCLSFYGNRAQKERDRFSAIIEHKANNVRQGSFSNQNVFYGDFKKTKLKDEKGSPVYLQVRKNFNGQAEILNTIYTNYSFL